MNVLQIIGGVLLMLSSILLIIVVVLQESKQPGLAAMTGAQSDSYLSKNRGKTLESKLIFVTKVLSITFFVLTIAMNLIIRYVK